MGDVVRQPLPPTKERRPSCDGSAELETQEEAAFFALLATRPGTKASAIACVKHVAACGLASDEKAGLARDDGGIAAGVVNEVSLTYARGGFLAALFVCDEAAQKEPAKSELADIKSSSLGRTTAFLGGFYVPIRSKLASLNDRFQLLGPGPRTAKS
jgi:hypothetical protein